MPGIRTGKACFVVIKARELDVKVAPEELDDGSNASDDGMQRILEDTPTRPKRSCAAFSWRRATTI